MNTFSCITHTSDEAHITQHVAVSPEAALRAHIEKLPLDDAEEPPDDLTDWLQRVASGQAVVTMQPVQAGMWMWLEGARHRPQYTTYVVRTKVE